MEFLHHNVNLVPNAVSDKPTVKHSKEGTVQNLFENKKILLFKDST